MFTPENPIIDLNSQPDLMGKAAAWFHDKWKIPEQAYIDSMASALKSVTGVPRWYIMVNDREEIVTGIGIIENDFHKRSDLTPNICALFVETAYRQRGIARSLLNHACAELSKKKNQKSFFDYLTHRSI